MQKIAIITARGGSKRIPGKNIKPFHGHPIMAYGIEAALKSNLFDEVMVSTDSEEIAAVAKQYGANVPFMRSSATSDDFATTADVLKEVLTMYSDLHRTFDYGCCIYPTAPFVTSEKLIEAFAQLTKEKRDVVFPVVQFGPSIWRSLQMSTDHKLSPHWPEHSLKRSQDLLPAYYDCGQFYFFLVTKFLESQSLMTANTSGILVSEMEVQDIDYKTDWELAEFKFAFQKNLKQ